MACVDFLSKGHQVIQKQQIHPVLKWQQVHLAKVCVYMWYQMDKVDNGNIFVQVSPMLWALLLLKLIWLPPTIVLITQSLIITPTLSLVMGVFKKV